MIDHLGVSLSSNISTYEERDYRRIISSHIQYMTRLCQISIQSVKKSIEQFLSTVFVSKQLVSENDFYAHIESLIEQTKENAPDSLNSIFFYPPQL